MSKKTDVTRSLPGNDGAWYLELLGIDGEDAPPSLRSAAKSSPDAETTGELVQTMWQAPTGDAFEGWAPSDMSRQIDSRRNYRWSIIVPVALAIVAVVVAAFTVPGMATRAAEQRAGEYRSVLADLRLTLADAQGALAVSTDPAPEAAALAATAAPLGDMAGRSAAVTRLGNDPLPSTPPFVPSSAIDDLAPYRSRLGPIGAEGSAIAERISAVADYREEVARLTLSFPELPGSAGAQETNDLSVALASNLADALAIVRDLPNDAALVSHRDLLAEYVQFFSSWQVDYIDALRQSDTAAATQLIGAIVSWQTDIDRQLTNPLSIIRSDVDADIVALAVAIDELTGDIPD